MASPKDKPKGYLDFILAVDVETTGICFNSDYVDEGHQIVSCGVVVADAHTFEPIEDLYVEIKWNQQSLLQKQQDPTFGNKAEQTHGLTFDYLEQNGIDESDAVEKLGNLIVKYWGSNNKIPLLGHNVHVFDLFFFRSMFRRHGIELRFGSRHYDTNTLGLVIYGTYNSDDLFDAVGLEKRDKHNALDDARMALETARRTKLIFEKIIGE